MPSPSPTSPLQSSIPVPPQSLSIFRPPYHPNLFPYGPYYPPIYVSPIHQFFSLNGFPQQPSVGNMHLPAAAGIKFPLPQLKAGVNTENTAHIGFPSGSFISPPVGYAPSPTVNSGSTTGNEDLAVSQLKENQIYTPGQLVGSLIIIVFLFHHFPFPDIIDNFSVSTGLWLQVTFSLCYYVVYAFLINIQDPGFAAVIILLYSFLYLFILLFAE